MNAASPASGPLGERLDSAGSMDQRGVCPLRRGVVADCAEEGSDEADRLLAGGEDLYAPRLIWACCFTG